MFQYNDGGRAAAGYKGIARDCVTRAIAIACELPYQTAYDLINAKSKQISPESGARTGVYKCVSRAVLAELGWTWIPLMKIGTGCKVHLKKDELPPGRIICKVSKHLVAVIDGVIHDNHDCSRGGSRCVYGYYKRI